MTWNDNCSDFDSRIEASAQDVDFNDIVFLLTQADAENPTGDKVCANKAILALISPVFYAQFYGLLSTKNNAPVQIVDGTAQGFKQLINFICHPKSFQLKVQNVTQVFDISYFAHKYQIGSLVSRCRQFLGNYNYDCDVTGMELDILNWSVSSERRLEMKEAFPAEHALLVNNSLEYIQGDFSYIFPNGKLKEDQDLPEEDLMIKILRSSLKCNYQELVLSVAIDFYCKKMVKRQKIVKGHKRLKVNDEKEWDENFDKIKSVIQFEKCQPRKLAEIYEKFLNKIPDKVLTKITMEISSSWKNKTTFSIPSTNHDASTGTEFSLSTSINGIHNDWIHHANVKSEVQIKFKASQNAILIFRPSEISINKQTTCPCDNYNAYTCCRDDFIIFQNGDYKEEVNFCVDENCYFYVKENKEATLIYKSQCVQESCLLHLLRMNKFNFSKGNFNVTILEVNGQEVASPCYTFLKSIQFIPL